MDRKTRGAWVVHHAEKLDNVSEPGDFDRITLAGKCGRLLATLAATDEAVLSTQQIRDLAKTARVNPTFELPPVLQALRDERLIDMQDEEVSVIGLTQTAILDHVGAVLEHQDATREEQASIYLAELASQRPLLATHAAEEICDTYELSTRQCTELFSKAETIGFTDHETSSGEKLYFNGNLFRVGDAASKVAAVLASLSPDDERKVREIEALLRKTGCINVDDIRTMLGPALFGKLNAIGLWDINELSNSRETTHYVTRPGAFAKFSTALLDDAFDLAKAFVAALTYGMQRSSWSRGQITMLPRLLQKLISGAWVGPVQAIGEDYKVLELRRVVEVRPDGRGFSMRLLKRDVGELALKVLTEGDASEVSLTGTIPSVAAATYRAPEKSREITRVRQQEMSKREVAAILQNLRSSPRR